MATPEEKQELIDNIKRPNRVYRISIWGYGGEAAYISLEKDVYDYWKKRIEEDEDRDILVDYVLDEERDEVTDVPKEYDFMGDPEDPETARYPWYDAPGEVIHQYGVDYSSARIMIEEVESEEYMSPVIETIVDGDLQSWVQTMNEEIDYYDTLEVDDIEDDIPPYVLQIYSSEKGTFFEGYLKTVGKFNPEKLKIVTCEYWNGDDVITSIIYDDEEVDNNGADTTGKGYSAAIWEN